MHLFVLPCMNFLLGVLTRNVTRFFHEPIPSLIILAPQTVIRRRRQALHLPDREHLEDQKYTQGTDF